MKEEDLDKNLIKMENKNRFTIYCGLNDYYLGNTIYRRLSLDGYHCKFVYNDVAQLESIDSESVFIAIINPEITGDKSFVEFVSNLTVNSERTVCLLENEQCEDFPINWGEIRYIDASSGLNIQIIETLEGVAKEPVGELIDLRKEAEETRRIEEERKEQERIAAEEAARIAEKEAKKAADDERRIYLRAGWMPTNFRDVIIEEATLSKNVEKGVKYLVGDGFPQDGNRAFSILKKAVLENPDDVLAAYYLAVCYGAELSGLEKDAANEEMIKGYKKAAEQGYEKAIIALAIALSNQSEDREPVIELLKKLQEINNAKGLFYLGMIDELDEHYSDALEKYYEAAEEGLPEAQNALGYMYAEGWGVEIDDSKAQQWFELANSNGLSQAKANLGMIYVKSGNSENFEKGYSMIREVAETGNSNAIAVIQEIDKIIAKQKEEERKRIKKEQQQEAAKKMFMDLLSSTGSQLKSAWDDLSSSK